MAYIPQSGSVVAFQSDPTKLVGTVSVVGTLGASIIGLPPVAVTNIPSVSGTVQVGNLPTNQNVSGSVVSFQAGTQITSLVSTVPSSVIVGASIFGLAPVNVTNTNINVSGSVAAFQNGTWSASVMTNVITSIATAGQVMGSVAALQGTNPWNMAGSVAAFQAGTRTTSLVSTVPSSVIVGASLFGQLPTGTAVLGSVAALQGTNPWNMAGSVAAFLNSTNASVITVVKPYSTSGTEFTAVGSIVSTSVTLLAASVSGKKHYITDFFFANSGSANPVITFQDGSTSIIGYTIVPTLGGSNAPGITTPLRSSVTGQDLAFKPSSASSILFYTVKGYIAA